MQVLTDLPIKHLRHQGMIFAFDVDTQNTQFAKLCYQAAVQQEVLLRPIGNAVYWMPPYTISEGEIDFMVNATLEAVKCSL
jgi:adenosylmethionine-8-amino-7-oxononanoate aminotransferase